MTYKIGGPSLGPLRQIFIPASNRDNSSCEVKRNHEVKEPGDQLTNRLQKWHLLVHPSAGHTSVFPLQLSKMVIAFENPTSQPWIYLLSLGMVCKFGTTGGFATFIRKWMHNKHHAKLPMPPLRVSVSLRILLQYLINNTRNRTRGSTLL